ncbi:complement C3-like [Lineus longissimus]|uniref:complement C3-like n=1 Tax=Lineus longissimus TaxID=88925 RepID=UPI002B4C333A
MMTPPWILGVFVTLAAMYLTEASPNLFVASPNLLRVNSDEDVWVTLHHTQNSPVTVKVYLENYPDRGQRFSARTVTIGKDESKKVTMRVGWGDIPQVSQQTYVYLVVECQALVFRKESVILLSKESGYLFLQTDKPLYNPHETVNIRVVSLDSEMKPSNHEITLDVINPNGDVLKRFNKKRATNGFVQEEFDLPKILVYGNWTLQASYKDTLQPGVKNTSIEFEVKEYVLPTFSTQVKIIDDYILESQPEIQYRITTEYVFGTAVTGRGTVYYYLLSPDGIELQIGYKEFDITGVHIGAITKDVFGDKWFPPENTRLLLRVNVREGATGKQESSSDSSAVFVKSPFVVSYERMPKFYRPGLPFSIEFDLTYPNKLVAAGIPISIKALVTTPGGGQQGAHANQIATKNYTTDQSGRQQVTLDIPSTASSLIITVSTRDAGLAAKHQANKPITLEPHVSGSNKFMVLQVLTSGAEVKINRNLQIRADFTESGAKKVNFMVVARGKILQHFTNLVNDRQTHENILISPLMSPQARVIAYYVSGREIISDSLVLEIVKSCGNELTITTEKNHREYLPKDNVKLTIAAGKRSTVSVLGVDKAVYLLSEKDILTRSKMFKKMLEMDIGCGPGGGKDASDVFKQAGLSVLAKTGVIAIPRRSTEGCPQNKFRRRRDVMATYSDIIARLSDQDKVCCNQGVSDSVDAVRTCRELTRDYGSTRRSCSQAYLQCCEAEKRRVAGGRGRSGANDDQLLQGSFENVEVDIRKDFQETWINELLTLGPNKASTVLTRRLPDSITTWVISGVSVSPDQGMCVAVPTNITSRKKFFVHVDLPYAAVRTEQLEVKATVYNLGNRNVRVHVSLKADDSICYAAEREKYTYRQEVTVEAKSAKSVTFPIVPLKAKDLPSEISVKALSNLDGDEVIKNIRVVNEGVKKYKTESIRLDPQGIMGDAGSGAANLEVTIDKKAKRQTVKIPLTFPVDTIPKTEKCSVSIHGNLLGPMVPSGNFDISKRFKLPTGCGEQNVITMGPLVYSTKYLLRIGKLTGKLEANAYDFITKGYESQLAYKKKDGSFAAWTYYPSSSWLTAFVTKVFCQASTFDQIGEKVREHVIDAVNWLFKNAQDGRSGKFFETHVVVHKEMLGKSLMNDVTLTSFIVECIYSCKDVIDLSSREFASPMRKAVQYLERNRQSGQVLGNRYGQAILTYALTLANSQHKFEENQLLWAMSNFDPVTGMRYWNLDGRQPDNHNEPTWYTKNAPAAAIETASYAILALLASGQESNFTNSGQIVSWLIRQRTKSGSFSSTTDTVLGLEALSEYAFRASSRSILKMNIRFYAGGTSFGVYDNLVLNETNSLIPILIENNLPIGDKLNVEATGTGLAQLQVECTYHAPAKDDKGCPFTLEVDSTEYKATAADLGPLDAVPAQNLPDRSRFGGFRFKRADDGGTSSFVVRIQSRIRFNGGQKVGMSMLEVSLFTGFKPYLPDLEKLKKDGKIDQFETTGSSVLFYLKEISSIVDTFVTFRATQKYKVGKTQPVAVKVYDYYEPNTRQCTKFYHPHARSALLAQSCDNSQGREVCACVAGTCAEYFGFDRAHLPRGLRFRIKNRNILYQDACTIYNYVVKVKAGQKFINKPLVEMQAEIQNVIKLGSDNIDTGETIHFVWNSECVYPLMEDGVSYLVMGMDGKQYVDKNGRAQTKYILDSSSHVVEWYGQDKRKYMEALNAFAGKLLRQGCP